MSTSWVGGDVASLRAAAARLEQYGHQASAAVGDLDASVGRIASDAGWTGDAAAAFADHWTTMATATRATGEFAWVVAGVLTVLADRLTRLDGALRAAAAEARAEGAVISPDGRPCAAVYRDAGALAAARLYAEEWQKAQDLARVARDQATGDLIDAISQAQGTAEDLAKLGRADQITAGDYIRGLIAVDAVQHRTNLQELEQLRAAHEANRLRHLEALTGGAVEPGAHAARGGTLSRLGTLEAEIVGRGRDVVSHLFDVRMADLAKGTAELFGQSARVSSVIDGSRALRFASELPVIDVAATGAVSYFQSVDDIQKGEDPTRAWTQNLVANGTGLAAGAYVGGVVTTAIAGTAAAPAVAVVGGAVVGGVVCVGVGDALYQGFHEHWGEDIQRHGLVGGIGVGVQNTFGRVGSDVTNIVSQVWSGTAFDH